VEGIGQRERRVDGGTERENEYRRRQHRHRAPLQSSTEAAARPQFNDGSQRDVGYRTTSARDSPY